MAGAWTFTRGTVHYVNDRAMRAIEYVSDRLGLRLFEMSELAPMPPVIIVHYSLHSMVMSPAAKSLLPG